MFFSYGASILLVALAVYGLIGLLRDIWDCYDQRKFRLQPSVSLVILVKNMEEEIEMLVRELIGRLEEAPFPSDAVIVDCGSTDFTYEIVYRLAEQCPLIEIFTVPGKSKPVSEALPLCRGSVIHILDLNGRIAAGEFVPTVARLLKEA